MLKSLIVLLLLSQVRCCYLDHFDNDNTTDLVYMFNEIFTQFSIQIWLNHVNLLSFVADYTSTNTVRSTVESGGESQRRSDRRCIFDT